MDTRAESSTPYIGKGARLWVHAPFWVCAIGSLQALLHYWLLGHGEHYIVTAVPIDDSYYYLQTAWNWVQLGVPAFDGVNATNGVQMLWFAMVSGLAALSPDKWALLYATLGLVVALLAACHVPIWLIARRLRRPDLAILAAALWAAATLSSNTLLSGMENALHAFVFWLVVWQVAEWFDRIERGKSLNVVGLSLVLVLNTWTRLDAGLYSAVLAVACLTRLSFDGGLKAHRQTILIAGVMVATGAALQFGFFFALAGTPIPVSTLVKLDWTCPVAPLWGMVHCDVGWEQIRRGTLVNFPWISQWLLLPALAAIGFGARSARPAERWWIGGLLAGAAVYVAVIFLRPAYGTFEWYHTPLFIMQVIVLASCASFLLHWRLSSPLLRNALSVAVAGALVVSSVSSFVASRPQYHVNGYELRDHVAKWIAENTPEDTVLAAWNSGQVAYFSERRTVNLDGLINSPAYFNEVLRTRDIRELERFLIENQVDYVVDYLQNDLTTRLPKLAVFERNDMQIVIWKFGDAASNLASLAP